MALCFLLEPKASEWFWKWCGESGPISKCTPASVSSICQSNSNQLPEEIPPRCWCCSFHLKNGGTISSHKAIPAAQIGENTTFVKMKMASLCSKESLWAQTNSEGQWIRKLAPCPAPPRPPPWLLQLFGTYLQTTGEILLSWKFLIFSHQLVKMSSLVGK